MLDFNVSSTSQDLEPIIEDDCRGARSSGIQQRRESAAGGQWRTGLMKVVKIGIQELLKYCVHDVILFPSLLIK